MSESKIPNVPEVVLSAEGTEDPSKLSGEDFAELKLLQEKIYSAQKDISIAQKDVVNAQLKFEIAKNDQGNFVKEKVFPKYKLTSGDMINIADGTIMRSGDPNLKIGKPELKAVPPPAVLG
jgi:hypothetical protein